MPEGYSFLPKPNAVASTVLSKSTWAVLALTCLIEPFVLVHYHVSIETDANVAEPWNDVFLCHAKEESQHAILDEMEWVRVNAKLAPEALDAATIAERRLRFSITGADEAHGRAPAIRAGRNDALGAERTARSSRADQ